MRPQIEEKQRIQGHSVGDVVHNCDPQIPAQHKACSAACVRGLTVRASRPIEQMVLAIVTVSPLGVPYLVLT